MGSAVLTLQAVARRYGDTEILRGVSLTVEPAETLAIVGPSGSGKSTLLNIVGSLDRPTSGSVRLGQVEVTALEGPALAAFRAEQVGFVFQEHHLLPQLTALENVLLPTLAARRVPGARPDDAAARRQRAKGLLGRVGVAHRAGAYPAQMSGGERQRVAVARALINAPALLLCDEPTGNLDHENGTAVVSLLLDVAAAQGATVLMVTHNAEHAARFGRCLRLADGLLVPDAAPSGAVR